MATPKLIFFAIVLVIVSFAAGFFGHSTNNCSTDRHYSYFSSKGFFDNAYNSATSTPADPLVKGIIVNHHLLAADLIAGTIENIATTAPVTVILISPNHFGAGDGDIIASVEQWETPYGMLPSDCKSIEQLQTASLLNVDERPFIKEHGISGIVPFIKRSLPNAKVIPIIVKDRASDQAIDQLVTTLNQTVGEKTIVIGSFDFSHYVTDAVAMEWDKDSIRAIKTFDYGLVKKLHIDSIPGLRLMLKYMDRVGAKNFTVTAHTDSGQLLGNPALEETTSYVDGIFKP